MLTKEERAKLVALIDELTETETAAPAPPA